MNLKAIVPLGLAGVLGLVAMFLVKNAIARKNAGPSGNGNTVAVVVGKRDAEPGTALTRDDLMVAHLPADAAPGQVFSNPDDLVGRVMQTPLAKGQAVLETLLAPTGSGKGLQALVPPGMRAVCVEVTEYTGVGGMLEPGCRVDLVAVVRDDKTKEPVARTVLQNIKVSAIGRSTVSVEPPPGQPLPPPTNSVTILCTPAQVQTLELASMAGRPWLVLRGGRDTQEVQVDSTRMSDVLGKPSDDGSENANTQQVAQAPIQPTTGPSNEVAAVTPAQPVNPRWTVRVIQGETESSSTFTLPAAPRTVEADTDVSTPVIPGSK